MASKSDPTWPPKSFKNQTWAPQGPLRMPNAARRPPGSHFGAMLEPFGTNIGAILQPFGHMFLNIVAGPKKWPGQFTHNEKNNNFYTSLQICSEKGFWPKLRSQLGFGHRDHQKRIPCEKLILWEVFSSKTEQLELISGPKRLFWFLWVRNFNFVTKLLPAWK